MKRRTYKIFVPNTFFIITLLIWSTWNYSSNDTTSRGKSPNTEAILSIKCNVRHGRILIGKSISNSESVFDLKYALFKEKIIDLLSENDDEFEKRIKEYMQDEAFRKRFNIFLENEEFQKHFNILANDFDLMKPPEPDTQGVGYAKSNFSFKISKPRKKPYHSKQNKNHAYSFEYSGEEKQSEFEERKEEKEKYDAQFDVKSQDYNANEKNFVGRSTRSNRQMRRKKNNKSKIKSNLSRVYSVIRNADDIYETQLINMITLNKNKKGKLFWIKYNKNTAKAIIPIIGAAISAIIILASSLNAGNIAAAFLTMILSIVFVLYKYKKCSEISKKRRANISNPNPETYLPT
ncbi:Plasmodium exported protein, unknown function [Plasmodium vivax]|uniref:Pv-fam-d protein n=1 Tax=Plasmodium vivax TaxID=5855 RepID=A0A1G4GRL9_PLAVI|nr:Plasmodium exported protein, unknown function [Plasmodium vivax]